MRNSERRTFHNQTTVDPSNRANDADITIAANVADGRLARRFGAQRSNEITPKAAIKPVSWVREPTDIATAVREELALVGKP
jgi:hypothetical protein